MAVDPGQPMRRYFHTAWRLRDGFLPGEPTALAQTTDGFLWIGTLAGVIRFDGARFEPWRPPEGARLPDDRVFALLGASDGGLWIGTGNGLARWKDGRLKVYATVGRFGALLEDRRHGIWAGHTRALSELPPLCRVNGEEFRCFGPTDSLPLHYVVALHEDRNGDVWVGGDGAVCRWGPDRPACSSVPGPAATSDRFGVPAISEDADGTLWICALPTGIWKLAAGHWTRFAGAPEAGLESDSMLSDRGGGLWIGTSSRGLLRLAQGRTDRFTAADGLSGDTVTGLLEDR